MRLWALALRALALRAERDAAFLGRDAEPPRMAWNYAQHGADWPGQCAEQEGQSPIALPPLAELANATAPHLFFRFPTGGYEEPVVLYNDGFLISATFGHDKKVGGIGLGSSFTNLEKSWSLQQMTLHAPSEHTWGGTHLPAELQLVHAGETPEDGLAIVVIGMGRGSVQTASVFWDTLIRDGLPEQKQEEKTVNQHFPDRLDFATVVGNKMDLKDTTGSPLVGDADEFPAYYSYEGSVTVPPCTAGVQYFVRAEPLLVNPQRLDSLITTIARSVGQTDGNYRMTQPLAGRSVTKLTAEDASGLESAEEVLDRAPAPTQSPVVNITDAHSNYDPSHEDAVAETEETKLAATYSDPSEFTIDELKAKAHDVSTVVAAFDQHKILQEPDEVAAQLTMVTSVDKQVEAQAYDVTQAELDEQKALHELQLAQQARKYAEGYDNLTMAESQLLTAQATADGKKQVVSANQKKLETLQNTLNIATADAQAILLGAQKQVEALNNASATGEGSSDGGAVRAKFTLPTGSAADPFSRHNAETVSRITADTGRLPRYLTPGLAPNHPALWGTVPVVPRGDEEGAGAIDTTAAVGNDEATTADNGVVEQPSPVVETMTVSA